VKKKAKKRNTAIENEGVRDSRMNRKEQKKKRVVFFLEMHKSAPCRGWRNARLKMQGLGTGRWWVREQKDALEQKKRAEARLSHTMIALKEY
jgi:hypothetical protein